MLYWQGDDDGESYYEKWTRHYEKPAWIEKLFSISPEEMDAVYERCVQKFNDACAKIDRQDTEAKVMKLLRDALGTRTYEVEGR